MNPGCIREEEKNLSRLFVFPSFGGVVQGKGEGERRRVGARWHRTLFLLTADFNLLRTACNSCVFANEIFR